MQEYPRLIPRQVVKDALRIGSSDTTHDEVIDRYIGWVSNAIQRRAGQPISKAPVVVEFDAKEADCNGLVMLSYWPVQSITLVETRDTAFGSEYATGTLSDYGRYRTGGLYYLRSRNGWGSQYRVTIEVGYDDVPGEIQQVAMEMVMQLLREGEFAGVGKSRLGVNSTSESDAKAGVTRTTTLLDMNPQWLDTIQYYARGETV